MWSCSDRRLEMVYKRSQTKRIKGSRSREAPDPRLAALDEHLARVRAEQAETAKRHEAEVTAATSTSMAFATAFRMSAEVIGGVILGVLIGFGVDRIFSSSPWGLCIFVLLGFAGGIFNLVRRLGVRDDAGTKS